MTKMSVITNLDEKRKSNAQAITGLMGGSRVLTLSGFQNIETLTAGERIITRSGMQILKQLCVTSDTVRPVIVTQGALGNDHPEDDLHIAPDQYVLLRGSQAQAIAGKDNAIVPVSHLVDNETIFQPDTQETCQFFTLLFDNEEVFYADGAEVLSAKPVEQAQENLISA